MIGPYEALLLFLILGNVLLFLALAGMIRGVSKGNKQIKEWVRND